MPQKKVAQRATYFVLGLNLFLLIIKAIAWRLSDTLSILSETVNSLTDVFASMAVLVCVHMAARGADEDHPFGHARAEPIAGLVVAIFTGIMGWEVLSSPLERLGQQTTDIEVGILTLPALIITLVIKLGMAIYLRKTAREVNSPALRASSIDCRNDVCVAMLAIFGVAMAHRYPLFDALAAMAIGVYILYGSYEVGRENVDYLMGVVPDASLLMEIDRHAASIPNVQAVHDIRAHYVGHFVHVELDVLIDGDLTTHDSHHIAEAVRSHVETIPAIDRAFVHVEPSLNGVVGQVALAPRQGDG